MEAIPGSGVFEFTTLLQRKVHIADADGICGVCGKGQQDGIKLYWCKKCTSIQYCSQEVGTVSFRSRSSLS
ncbi:hypothetical protein BJ165DRAFT_559443 [Panaeolus papilionaceus]|nr:hypothetical protein BJ165DRAFT_559443 [Panaeolus papilionaceus]